MATRESLAIKRDNAVASIHRSARRIADGLGIEPVVIPTHDRDTEHLQAEQLHVLSVWFEQLADALERQDPDAGLELQPDVAESLETYLGGTAGVHTAPNMALLSDVYLATDYESMTVAELKAHAEARGVDLAGASRKADIIAALEAADAAWAAELAGETPAGEEPETPVE